MQNVFRKLLFNPVTGALFVIGMITFGWNIYVATHNDGALTGKVVDSSGDGVAQATVIMTARHVASDIRVGSTVSDDKGEFRFDKHGQYDLVLTAEKAGVGRSLPLHIQLYFENENLEIKRPIVLKPYATGAGSL